LEFEANAILQAYGPVRSSEAFRASHYTENEEAVKTVVWVSVIGLKHQTDWMVDSDRKTVRR
jgi:hypothetical protein